MCCALSIAEWQGAATGHFTPPLLGAGGLKLLGRGPSLYIAGKRCQSAEPPGVEQNTDLEARTNFDARTARTWAEIDLPTLANNAQAARRLAGPHSVVMAVVKADGYGHGAAPVARAVAAAGAVIHFAVASAGEALELRRVGIRQEIYTLSSFLPGEADAIVQADLIAMVSSSEQIAALAQAARNAPLPSRCFLMIDTGMGREGCLPDDAVALWQQAAEIEKVCITGIATHFSSADESDPASEEATATQQRVWSDFLDVLGPDALRSAHDGRGNRGVLLSRFNSPALLRLPADAVLPTGVRGYLVRAGLLLYGIEPYRGAFAGVPDLRPALSWRARITLIKDMPAGATVGYGRTHTLTNPARIATVAAGYADGLQRRLSNRGVVLVQGHRCPIVGRVSMDQCQIDVTEVPDKETLVGAIVTIVGREGSAEQSVLDLAETMETTPHEILCALTRRVPRLYR